MTQEATQLEVPNFEATTDGKKIFKPTQWLERSRQYTKRKYKTDIAELIRGEEMTQADWATKETQIQVGFVWGIGPEALYQKTRAEYETETDKMAIKELIRLFNKYFLPKRNTYHNWGEFFWTKQIESETPEDFWWRLIEIEKECNFENITATSKLEMKKTIEMIKQNTYEKNNNKNTLPEELISSREKEIKEKPIQRMEKFNKRPRNKFNNNRPCRFCNAPNWSQTHKGPALDQSCSNCGKKGHFARACRQKENYKDTECNPD